MHATLYTPELVREVFLRAIAMLIIVSSLLVVEGFLPAIHEYRLRLSVIVLVQVITVRILSKLAILTSISDLLEIELLNLVFLCFLLFFSVFSVDSHNFLVKMANEFFVWTISLIFVRVVWVGRAADDSAFASWPPFGLLGFTGTRPVCKAANRKANWQVRGMILGLGILACFLSTFALQFFQIFAGIAGFTIGGFFGYGYCTGLFHTLNQGLENEQKLAELTRALEKLQISYADLKAEFTEYVMENPEQGADDLRAFLMTKAGKGGKDALQRLADLDPALLTLAINSLIEVGSNQSLKKVASKPHLSLVRTKPKHQQSDSTPPKQENSDDH